MYPAAQGYTSEGSQGDIIAGQVNPKEAVTLLKVAHTVRLPPAIGEIGIDKVGDSAIGTGPHGLGDKCIGRGFVTVANHGDYIHQVGLRACLICRHLDETYELIFQKGPDENAMFQVSGGLSTHHLHALAEVTEWPSLSNRALVVDFPYSVNNIVVEGNFP